MHYMKVLIFHLMFRPDGYIFEKEAILEYIVHQKTENARKMKEYEKQKAKIQVTTFFINTETESSIVAWAARCFEVPA